MKKILILIFLSSYIVADVDWSNTNECKLPDYSAFVNKIVNEMTLEQKVGQIIMPEINSISPTQVKKFQIGTILNGGGGFPNQNKNSDIQDWKDLSESYYDALQRLMGLRYQFFGGQMLFMVIIMLLVLLFFLIILALDLQEILI